MTFFDHARQSLLLTLWNACAYCVGHTDTWIFAMVSFEFDWATILLRLILLSLFQLLASSTQNYLNYLILLFYTCTCKMRLFKFFLITSVILIINYLFLIRVIVESVSTFSLRLDFRLEWVYEFIFQIILLSICMFMDTQKMSKIRGKAHVPAKIHSIFPKITKNS